jgi:hypothetical protein
MPQIRHLPAAAVNHPTIDGCLAMMESIASMIPELLLEAKKQGYEEAIRRAVGSGLNQHAAANLMVLGPFDPHGPKVVRPAMDPYRLAAQREDEAA